jgi:hypothetical protein
VHYFNVTAKKGKKLTPLILVVTQGAFFIVAFSSKLPLEAVLCVDPDTRRVMKSNPLTEIRRWAVTPSSITIDYGDY